MNAVIQEKRLYTNIFILKETFEIMTFFSIN